MRGYIYKKREKSLRLANDYIKSENVTVKSQASSQEERKINIRCSNHNHHSTKERKKKQKNNPAGVLGRATVASTSVVILDIVSETSSLAC